MKVLLKPIAENLHPEDVSKPRLVMGLAQIEQSPPLVSQQDLSSPKWRLMNGELAITKYVDEYTEALRLKRQTWIRRRRDLKSNFWYPFNKRMQHEVAELEVKIQGISEQIVAKTRTITNIDELLAELKQGHERLASCLQRLENKHGQEGAH